MFSIRQFVFVILAVVAVLQRVAAAVPECAVVTAFIEARFPDSAKSRMQQQAACSNAQEARESLAFLERTAKEWSALELELASARQSSGDTKGAADHLKRALDFDPGNEAASKALRDAAAIQVEQKVRQAETFRRAGKIDDAIRILNEARELDPDHPEVRKLDDSIRQHLANKVRSNVQVGKYDEAMADVQALLTADPSLSIDGQIAAHPGLRWSRLRTMLEMWGLYVGQLFAVTVIALWLLARIARRYCSRRLLELQDFANPTDAPGMEHAIEAMLTNLSRGSSRSRTGQLQVTRPLEGAKLPVEVTSALPATSGWAKAIPALVEYIFPRKTLPIKGVLHKDSERGTGITVQLVTLVGDNVSETFWAKDFGIDQKVPDGTGKNTHYPLAEYVAIWLLFQLSKPNLHLLGTNNWKSYAFFRAGVKAEDRGDSQQAKSFYLRALKLDDRLHAARLNLSLLASGPERLLVMDALERAARDSARSDATRYHARYARALRKFDNDEIEDALADSDTLLRDIARTCWRYGFYGLWRETQAAVPNVPRMKWYRRPKQLYLYLNHLVTRTRFWRRRLDSLTLSPRRTAQHRELADYLKHTLPVATAMWAGLKFRLKQSGDFDAILESIEKADHSPWVLANLACVYSLRAASESDEQKRLAHLETCLEKLQLALWMEPKLVTKLADDASLGEVRTSERSTANGTIGQRFGAIIARHMDVRAPKAPDALPLASYAIVGREHAEKLAARNIRSESELLIACITATQREDLARALKVGGELVRQWAGTVELTHIPSIRSAHTNLLNRCRVFSLAELSGFAAAELSGHLADWAVSLQIDSPSLDVVKSWVERARSMTTCIVS